MMTKNEIQEKIGKKTFFYDVDTLSAKLFYQNGIKYFDEILNGLTLEQIDAVIFIEKYPKGFLIKIAKGFGGIKTYNYAIASSDIIKVNLNQNNLTLKIGLQENEISFLIRKKDINKISDYFSKYLNEVFEITVNETTVNNHSQVIEKKGRGKLNVFLIIILCLGLIGTITHNINNILEYQIATFFGQQYFEIFCIVTIFFALIHILGIVYTLYRKTILGIWVVFGNLWVSLIVCDMLNNIFKSTIFNVTSVFNQALLSSIIFSLLLFLKFDKKSAWTLLKENYYSDLKRRTIINNETIDIPVHDNNTTEITTQILIDNIIQTNATEKTYKKTISENESNEQITNEKSASQTKEIHIILNKRNLALVGLSVIIIGLVISLLIEVQKRKEFERKFYLLMDEQINEIKMRADYLLNDTVY